MTFEKRFNEHCRFGGFIQQKMASFFYRLRRDKEEVLMCYEYRRMGTIASHALYKGYSFVEGDDPDEEYVEFKWRGNEGIDRGFVYVPKEEVIDYLRSQWELEEFDRRLTDQEEES